jgi:hypothetical protein
MTEKLKKKKNTAEKCCFFTKNCNLPISRSPYRSCFALLDKFQGPHWTRIQSGSYHILIIFNCKHVFFSRGPIRVSVGVFFVCPRFSLENPKLISYCIQPLTWRGAGSTGGWIFGGTGYRSGSWTAGTGTAHSPSAPRLWPADYSASIGRLSRQELTFLRDTAIARYR